MSYFKKLNLPANPLIDSNSISGLHIPYGFIIAEPSEIFTSEVLAIFNNLDLRPKMVVLHGRNNQTSNPSDRLIHSDISYDPTVKNSWRNMVAAVNWEIEGSYTNFFWYDMNDMKKCWPAETAISKVFNGIHYGERLQFGIPENIKILDQTTIDRPTLVRTDIPHTTLYHNPISNRIGISLRFFEEDYNYSWDDALKKFQSIVQQ
jgi:hypothetical protein